MQTILPRPILALLLATLGTSAAAVDEFRFDRVHSQVQFHVEHLGFAFSEGEFQQLEGSFHFDPADAAKASCTVTIPMTGLDMDDATWTKKMLSKDWFNAEQFPEMRFVCTSLELEPGAKEGKLTGQLTLLGVERPVTLDLRFNRLATHKFSQAFVAGFSAEGSIKRSDFGMTHLVGDIGDTVAIRLEIEGIRKTQGGGPKK
ncbi:MAG: polyisoprenoid-binding protein [Ahniella sp.]|nr:polyisoprenoid-binding protein [Ahniella sp.]